MCVCVCVHAHVYDTCPPSGVFHLSPTTITTTTITFLLLIFLEAPFVTPTPQDTSAHYMRAQPVVLSISDLGTPRTCSCLGVWVFCFTCVGFPFCPLEIFIVRREKYIQGHVTLPTSVLGIGCNFQINYQCIAIEYSEYSLIRHNSFSKNMVD